MKLDNLSNQQEEPIKEIVEQQVKGLIPIKKEILKKGNTLYKCSLIDNSVVPAEFESVIDVNGNKSMKVVTNENEACLYIQAHKLESVRKLFDKKIEEFNKFAQSQIKEEEPND